MILGSVYLMNYNINTVGTAQHYYHMVSFLRSAVITLNFFGATRHILHALT